MRYGGKGEGGKGERGRGTREKRGRGRRRGGGNKPNKTERERLLKLDSMGNTRRRTLEFRSSSFEVSKRFIKGKKCSDERWTLSELLTVISDGQMSIL